MAFGELPTLGLCRYGRHTFNETTDTTDIKITPVRDAGNRTVIYSVYEISLTETIAGTPAATQGFAREIIRELSIDGQPFTYNNRGIGNLAINTGGRAKDVMWGPKVGVIGMKPLGNGQAFKLTWSVQVAIPTCADAKFEFAAMEFVFKLKFRIAPNGDTTRIYSGHLKIPNNRDAVHGRLAKQSVNDFRTAVVPPLIPGFRRLDREFEIDESKTTLTFSITDEEMPATYPPPGVMLCSASHNYRAESLTQWVGTIEAEYELLRGQGVFAAVIPFLSGIVKDRLAQVLTMRAGMGLPGVPAGDPIRPQMTKFEVSEPTIYGPGNQRVKMSLSYLVAGVGLEAILQRGGLWRAVPGSDWAKWVASVSTALSGRGTADLTFRTNEDKLVDLCGAVEPIPTAPAPRRPQIVPAGASTINPFIFGT